MEDTQKELIIQKSRYKDICKRNIDYFIGLCDMAVADGKVHQKEAERLLNFIQSHPEIINKYPVKLIYGRLLEMFNDKIIDEDEEKELFSTLSKISSRNYDDCNENVRPCPLFVDDQLPEIIFKDKEFCLTGNFKIGPKCLIEDTLQSLGATVNKNPRKKTTKYLVVGELCSDTWKHENYGIKLETAKKWKNEGVDIKIITEKHLLNEIEKLFSNNK